MMATHLSAQPSQHRLALIEQRGAVGIFLELDCKEYSRITCPMKIVTPTFETLKEWRKENGL